MSLHQEWVMVEIPKPFPVLGHPVHLMDNYADWLASRLQQGAGIHVVTLNAEMTMQAETNATLASVISRAELVIPDGSGIVFYFWLQGIRLKRCPGIELAESLLQQAGQPDKAWTVFFYGGAPGVAETAAQQWQQRIPELRVVGQQHGYLSQEEEQNLQQTLRDLQPQLILVGLGVPRQEFWIAEQRSLCPQSVWIGVGGSFDIWAGLKTRAPMWLRNNHLEWVYRLYKEPWRWRRMLALPQFARRAVFYRLTQKPTIPQELP